MLSAVTNPQKEEGAFVVRRAFFKSFLLVLVLGAVGYGAGSVLLVVSIRMCSQAYSMVAGHRRQLPTLGHALHSRFGD